MGVKMMPIRCCLRSLTSAAGCRQCTASWRPIGPSLQSPALPVIKECAVWSVCLFPSRYRSRTPCAAKTENLVVDFGWPLKLGWRKRTFNWIFDGMSVSCWLDVQITVNRFDLKYLSFLSAFQGFHLFFARRMKEFVLTRWQWIANCCRSHVNGVHLFGSKVAPVCEYSTSGNVAVRRSLGLNSFFGRNGRNGCEMRTRLVVHVMRMQSDGADEGCGRSAPWSGGRSVGTRRIRLSAAEWAVVPLSTDSMTSSSPAHLHLHATATGAASAVPSLAIPAVDVSASVRIGGSERILSPMDVRPSDQLKNVIHSQRNSNEMYSVLDGRNHQIKSKSISPHLSWHLTTTLKPEIINETRFSHKFKWKCPVGTGGGGMKGGKERNGRGKQKQKGERRLVNSNHNHNHNSGNIFSGPRTNELGGKSSKFSWAM